MFQNFQASCSLHFLALFYSADLKMWSYLFHYIIGECDSFFSFFFLFSLYLISLECLFHFNFLLLTESVQYEFFNFVLSCPVRYRLDL